MADNPYAVIDPPGGGTATPVNPYHVIDPPEVKPAVPIAPATTAPQDGVGATALHILKSFGAGIQEGAQFMPGMGIAGVVDAFTRPQVPVAFPPGTPPNALARYGGAVAESVGRGPMLAATAPVATVAGALGGQAGLDVSGGNPWAGLAGGFLAGGLGGGAEAIGRSLFGIGTVQNLAKSLGGVSRTIQDAGSAIKTAAERWMKNDMKVQESEAWQDLDQALPRNPWSNMGPETDLTNTEGTLRDILKMGDPDSRVSAAAKLEGGGSASKLWDILSQKAVSPTTQIAPMSWDTVRSLRSWIGEGMKDPILKGMGQQNLDKLYGALSEDLKTTAKTYGLEDAFEKGNAKSTELRTLAEDHIGKIAEAATPGAAFRTAMADSGRDGTRLSVLRAQLGTATDELAAAHLLQTKKGWENLAKEAKEALVPNGIMRERLDAAVALPTRFQAGMTSGASIAGELFGDVAGQWAATHLGMDPLVGKMAGMGIGMAAPIATGGIATAITHPSVLRAPMAGTISSPAAKNPLSLLPSQ